MLSLTSTMQRDLGFLKDNTSVPDLKLSFLVQN